MKTSNGLGFGHDGRFFFRDLPVGGGFLQVWKGVDTWNMTHLVVEGFRFGILQQVWGNGKGAIKVNLGSVLFEDISSQILMMDVQLLKLPRYWES